MLKLLVIGALAAVVGGAFLRELPGLKRYQKIAGM
jgi:hypothetical protein